LLEILRKWLPKITNSRKIRIISKNSDETLSYLLKQSSCHD
jgi:hypothetical protein